MFANVRFLGTLHSKWPCRGHPCAYSGALRRDQGEALRAVDIGQLRAKQCPVCAGPNEGKWTCPDCTPQVNLLRELFRNLQAWHSALEAHEVGEVIESSDGKEWSIWDADYLYGQRHRLPPQMRAAIELFLYENLLERDAAVRMGVSASNPVAMYATVGCTKLVGMARNGELSGFTWEIAS